MAFLFHPFRLNRFRLPCRFLCPNLRWLLYPAVKCAILSIEKGKAIEAALPLIAKNCFTYKQPSLLCVVAAISFFLVNLINQIHKGNNEYTDLDQILICNIHCIALLSSVRRAA